MQKLLKKLGLLIVIISFNGCNPPEKPSIFSGIVIAELNEIYYYNDSTGEERYSEIVTAGCEVDLSLHKSIVHSNQDWNKILLYIRLLENEAPKKRRKNFRQAKSTFDVLTKEVQSYGL